MNMTLPMANDQDLIAGATALAHLAVEHGFLSDTMLKEMEDIKKSRVSKTFQWRLIAPLTTATVKRLHQEGASVPALAGFFRVGALLDLNIFREALQDLQERFSMSTPPGRSPDQDQVPLTVAMDFAAAREPSLDRVHLEALCVHLVAHGLPVAA